MSMKSVRITNDGGVVQGTSIVEAETGAKINGVTGMKTVRSIEFADGEKVEF